MMLLRPDVFMCEGEHSLWNCSEFSTKSVEEGQKLVEENSLCFNCFRTGQVVNRDFKKIVRFRTSHNIFLQLAYHLQNQLN